MFKEYAYLKQNIHYGEFPLNLITILNKNTLQRLSHEKLTDLTNFGFTTLDE